MKAVTSNLIDTLQGRHQNWIAKPGNYVPIQGLETRVSISRFRSSVSRKALQVNSRLAFSIIQIQYSLLKLNVVVFQSWVDQASTYSSSYGYTINSWMLFCSWYIQQFYSQWSSNVRPSGLVNSDVTSWTNRETIFWN